MGEGLGEGLRVTVAEAAGVAGVDGADADVLSGAEAPVGGGVPSREQPLMPITSATEAVARSLHRRRGPKIMSLR